MYRIVGHLNGEQYVEILETVMTPYVAEVFEGRNWVFQEDRSPIHTSRLVREWEENNLEELRGTQIDWPSKGADMNLIENVWAVMKRKLMFKVNYFKRKKNFKK